MQRTEVCTDHKWKTEDIFTDDEEWEKLFDSVSARLDTFSEYEGKLGDKDKLLSFMRLEDEIGKDVHKLHVYAQMKHDEDSREAKYSAYISKISMLYSNYGSETAFADPELASQDDGYLQSLIDDERFADYDYNIKRIKAGKAHLLDKEQEKLISMLGGVFDTFQVAFGMVNNVDLPFPEIEFGGETVRLSHAVYGSIMHGGDREKRREAYGKYYEAYKSLQNTITQIYYGNIKADVFLSKARKFDSCLDYALFNEDVSGEVYKNLLGSVGTGLADLHRYVSDRKKLLGSDKLYFYDMNAPLVGDVEFKMEYDDAYNYVIKGLAPLGKEYQALLKRGHDERWIDVEETEGKRSGAYSIPCYGVHPFVLLNYQPIISELYTIAHEMGHSLHTYFSQKNQPFAKSGYTIFVAEVASTVNEVLLLKYMLNEAEDINLKKYLLNYYLDTIRATLFRQAMFAEFEYEAHSMAEREEPLTKDTLCLLYEGLNKKYYGEDIVHDYDSSCEWMRIPHFYSAFYVYKYATGITAAINIADRILRNGESAVVDYFRFLSSGGSSDPVSLLRYAGVDLTSIEPFTFAMKEFADTLTEFEKLMGI